jgi:hypothetical protein
MAQNKSYHPKVIVNDHFDNIINQIDIKTESLFQNPKLDEEKIDQFNALREKQLDLIKVIKDFNLKNVKFDEENFQKEWSYILNESSLDYQQKIDEIKVKLITIDCVLVKDASSKSEYSLWVTNWFNKSDNLKFIE